MDVSDTELIDEKFAENSTKQFLRSGQKFTFSKLSKT